MRSNRFTATGAVCVNRIFLLRCLDAVRLVCRFAEQQQPRRRSVKSISSATGSPVYIQIFKEERTLDLYVKWVSNTSCLIAAKFCNYSGGLGPKRRQGDFKSPKVLQVQSNQLARWSFIRPSTHFPNAYDRAHGYDAGI